MQDTIMDAQMLARFDELTDGGWMYAALDELATYIEEGIEAERFTTEQAESDLTLALRVAYAAINIDDYEHYLMAVNWLARVEDKAAGCGMWFYRYSVSLIYLGRLDEALTYAERGVREEPDYPWGWLNLAKLRCHFGDRAGAHAAVDKGLELEPGDYEFLCTRREIDEGKTLADMNIHYISPEDDQQLTDDEALNREKQLAVSSILRNEENLKAVLELLSPTEWKNDSPYCKFVVERGGRPIVGAFGMNEAAVSNLPLSWVARLVNELEKLIEQARQMILTQSLPAVEPEELVPVRFTVRCDLKLLIHFGQESEGYAAVYNTDFELENRIFADAQEAPAPESYTSRELAALDQHIERYFGKAANVLHELVSTDIHVDIYVIEPTEKRNYFTLVTCGMGAHRMSLPDDAQTEFRDRAELLITLPANWKVDGRDERWYWPIRALKVLARLPISDDSFLAWGHSISKGSPFAENTDLSGMLLLGAQDAPSGCALCTLPGKEQVAFYQIIPLYEEEVQYKLEHGATALLERMGDVDHVVEIDRENTCSKAADSAKNFFLSEEEIRPLLEDWDGPGGCIATHRITVDGYKVGYMYREEPDANRPDSGWRFSAGDESDDYMDDPKNSGVYHLNTICNYDPEIIPLLRAPYGSAFYRDEKGNLVED